MKDLEIPLAKDRDATYRFFEMLPGLLTYSMYILPVVLSIVNPTLAAYLLICYVLIWVFKSIAMSTRVLQGYSKVKQARALDWVTMTRELTYPDEALQHHRRGKNGLHNAHLQNLERLRAAGGVDMDPDKLVHVIMIATYNEPPEIINPTIEYILQSAGLNGRNAALFMAYEARAGEKKEQETKEAIKKFGKHFLHAEAVKHVLGEGENIGKGSNAVCAAKRISAWAEEAGINPEHILVTVLDADNRPDKNYFTTLSYTYLIAPDRKRKSYQPMAIYTNNVWDVPAIMRLCAMSNTYFHTANSMRLHALRNFSAHSQSLDSLHDTQYWSMRTVVEDGHQFFRAYFAFDGQYEVLPLFAPIYQDAVWVGGYRKSLRAQFKQIQRWTYGASDIAYIATKALQNKKVSRWDVMTKLGREIEKHVGWATSAPLLLLAGWIPLFFADNSGENLVAQQLPYIISRINTFAVFMLLVSMYIGIRTLPTKPGYYRRTRWFAFLWQWIFIPVVGIVFNSYAALTSQTRLIFGRYVENFVVTEKAVKQPKTKT